MIVGEAVPLAILGGLPGDPFTLGAGVLVIVVVTFAGSFVPALRAVRTSPLQAIREE